MITIRRDCNGNARSHKRLLLGLSLAVMLVSSIVPVYLKMPAAYAVETFKTFDGNDSIEVPSSADLQLTKFAVEVRFKIDKIPLERGYFVSKSTGNGILDQNYALYVTKNGAIGGGFRATDGEYYHLYSWRLVSLGTWHVATLEYDGSQLILQIDDKLARKLTVGKNPDMSGTGSLYIGGNPDRQEGFLVGDIDYVSIIDRIAFKEVYFNDFGDSSPPVNSAAVALNDWGWTYKNTAKMMNVLSNDSDPDGDALAITSVTNPPHGSAVKNSGGTITYTPDTGYVGTDSYQYTISDGKGGTDTGSVTIQVRDTPTTNNPPNAVNDSTGTTKNTPVTTNVLSNDSDPDGNTLTITSVTNPPHGSAVKNSGGTITYTPDTGYVGTDSYQYTISDGTATDTATVTVSVSDTAPPPPTGSVCSDMPVKNMRGVVFNDGPLAKGERATSSSVQTGYVTESLKYIKSNGFNTIRVPFYWEAYVNNPTVFMEELDLVARTADAQDLCIVFANFHFHTSSYWGIDHGKGFPSFMVKNFPNKNNNYIATAGPFWDAFLSNSIVVNGRSGWDLQGDFIKSVINKVDHYGSVSGYEILNEPHLFNAQMYDKLGNYHTYLAKKMRTVTDNKIFFDRETAWGFTRDPTQEYKIVPDGVSRLVYAVQLYAVPTTGSIGLKQINNFKNLSVQFGTEVFICEMAQDTQFEAETFLSVMKSYGFGWTAHAWRPYASPGLGESYYESSTDPATTVLKILKAAMQKIYWG